MVEPNEKNRVGFPVQVFVEIADARLPDIQVDLDEWILQS